MVRKPNLEALAVEVERARLLALQATYDALLAAASRARLYFTAGAVLPLAPDATESRALIGELRRLAVILDHLAPDVERAPTGAEQLADNFFTAMAQSFIPGMGPDGAPE